MKMKSKQVVIFKTLLSTIVFSFLMNLTLLFYSSTCFAAAEVASRKSWSLGFSINSIYKKHLNGIEYNSYKQLGLELAYYPSIPIIPNSRISFDYSPYHYYDGSQSFGVRERRHDLNGWWLRTPASRNSSFEWWYGAGLGWSYQTVKNYLYQTSVQASSAEIYRGGIRTDFIFWLNKSLFFDLSGRIFWWNINPTTTAQIGWMLGHDF